VDFPARLKATAIRTCEQEAVTLGYARKGSDAADVTITRSEAIRLIGTLTAHTTVRAPGVPVPDTYQVGIPMGGAQAPGPAWSPPPARQSGLPRRGQSYIAGAAGSLPFNGSPRVGGVRLPPGHRAGDGLPEWETDAAPSDAIDLAARLADAFPRTGLWPVLWSFPDEPTS
jgi:hypothetical protein